MKKPHLFSSEEPWTTWNVALPTLCGRTVANAHWIAAVDGDAEAWINAPGYCEKCKFAARKRYIYLIAEGQEALDEAV